MDAAKYLRIRNRMTQQCKIDCEVCPLSITNNGAEFDNKPLDCDNLEVFMPEKAIDIAEKWAKEHPSKTRQSELLKLFPNAKIQYGTDFLQVCPQFMDKEFGCDKYDIKASCSDCRRQYWLTEIECEYDENDENDEIHKNNKELWQYKPSWET